MNPNGNRKSKVVPVNGTSRKIFNGKYQLNAETPVKYKTVDYYMLVEDVRLSNEAALRDIKRGRAKDILDHVLDSLEFLSYIHK